MYTNQHKPNTNIGECQLQTSLLLLGLCILIMFAYLLLVCD